MKKWGSKTYTIDFTLFQIFQVLCDGRSKGMMCSGPAALGEMLFILVGTGKQWELGDPEEMRVGR